MTITAYAFPVLYDISFPGTERESKTDQHGMLVIEFEDGRVHYVQAFLFNHDNDLRGSTPRILAPNDYDANSWWMWDTSMYRTGIEYFDGSIRVHIKPLPLNSFVGEVIRNEYHDIPLKTTKELHSWE